MKLDLHTHYYPPAYFERIERSGGDFSFGASPTGQRIIRYKGARFFGVTAPMTDVGKRLEDMDRVGIDVEVLSLSTPNVFFAEGRAQIEVARMVNDAYADLIAKRPGRFLGFASIPMDDPDGALRELARALDELRLQGVVLLSNIRGRALADPAYRPFFAECDRRKACVFVHPMIRPRPSPSASTCSARSWASRSTPRWRSRVSATPASSSSCRTSAGSSRTRAARSRTFWSASTRVGGTSRSAARISTSRRQRT